MQWLQSHEAAVRDYAAAELLDLYNESWSEDDVALNAQGFADALTLESITIGTDGEADIYYDDGDLFAGHVVIVSVNEHRSFIDAQIAG